MAEGIIISVKVTPIIREFIICTNGSDLVICKDNSFIGEKIKYLLKLPPKNYKPDRVLSNKIRFQLQNIRIMSKRIFTEYRNYLDTSGNRIIFNELNSAFKAIFHNYVAGYIIPKEICLGSQKEAIMDFCDMYKLTCDNINYEMLKKSWDRSEERIKAKRHILHKQFIKNRSK